MPRLLQIRQQAANLIESEIRARVAAGKSNAECDSIPCEMIDDSGFAGSEFRHEASNSIGMRDGRYCSESIPVQNVL